MDQVSRKLAAHKSVCVKVCIASDQVIFSCVTCHLITIANYALDISLDIQKGLEVFNHKRTLKASTLISEIKLLINKIRTMYNKKQGFSTSSVKWPWSLGGDFIFQVS